MGRPGVLRGPYKSRKPVVERFWKFVSKPADGLGCWLWTGFMDARGYGRITDVHGQTPVKAHRLSWEIANGPIPDGLGVLHRCDTPSCVNPEHLFVGTHTDNMRDAARKGRVVLPGRAGSAHPNAKLTEAQAREIYLRARDGTPRRVLADEFGISVDQVRNIALRRFWRAATEEVACPGA